MNAFQVVVTVVTALIGILTGLATLYAKYLDIKKAARESEPPRVATIEAPRPEPIAPVSVPRFENPPEPPPRYVSPYPDRSDVDLARRAVKAPAITMIVMGVVSLFFTVIGLGYNIIDQYVTPLNDDTKKQQAFVEAIRKSNLPPPPGMPGAPESESERIGIIVMMMFMMITLPMASAVAIWAGIGMLRLRGYWVSVVGSYSIMGAAFMCCFAGIPIGIWSLSVLMRPEVKASFR